MLSRDDIIELMQEAGWKKVGEGLWGNVHDGCMFLRALEPFAKLAYEAGAAAEREACARVCEDSIDLEPYPTLTEMATAIRARSKE
jgi:hypothetical protein